MADPYDALVPLPKLPGRDVARGVGNIAHGMFVEPVLKAREALRGRMSDRELRDFLFDAAVGVIPGAAAVKGAKAVARSTKGAAKAAVEEGERLPSVASVGRAAPEGGGVYPGIYKPAGQIVDEAAAMVAPEHPALKQLFGVTRGDLYDISQQGRRAGNAEPMIATKPGARGSYVAEGVMNPENAGRVLDAMRLAEKRAPDLVRGMDPWYVMDPAFDMMKREFGPEEATKLYRRFNTIVPMASPGSDVLTELNRGTAANMMAARGEFDKFVKYAGMAEGKRGKDFPEELRDVGGHPYHSTSQASPMQKFVESGAVDMQSPKVPLYMQASGVPETGFQTSLPVPDAHFGRALGIADVRKGAERGASLRMPEYQQLGPWYRENIAEPLGVQAVPAQARQWGLFAPQTGVDTAVGAPKLELLAQKVAERAAKTGQDPKKLLMDVLSGRQHAQWLLPGAGVGVAAAGVGADEPPLPQ